MNISDKVAKHSLAYLFVQKWFTGDVSYYAKIWPKLISPFTNADFQSIFARIATQRNTYRKKLQLTRIGSPLRAFLEPKMNSVRCPLAPQRGGGS